MSYDIDIINHETGVIRTVESPHQIAGGTFEPGTTRLTLNITYNYCRHFKELFGPEGIRSLYGNTVREALPILVQAAVELELDGDANPDPDYWKATGGNVRAALYDLIRLCMLAHQDDTIRGD